MWIIFKHMHYIHVYVDVSMQMYILYLLVIVYVFVITTLARYLSLSIIVYYFLVSIILSLSIYHYAAIIIQLSWSSYHDLSIPVQLSLASYHYVELSLSSYLYHCLAFIIYLSIYPSIHLSFFFDLSVFLFFLSLSIFIYPSLPSIALSTALCTLYTINPVLAQDLHGIIWKADLRAAAAWASSKWCDYSYKCDQCMWQRWLLGAGAPFISLVDSTDSSECHHMYNFDGCSQHKCWMAAVPFPFPLFYFRNLTSLILCKVWSAKVFSVSNGWGVDGIHIYFWSKNCFWNPMQAKSMMMHVN